MHTLWTRSFEGRKANRALEVKDRKGKQIVRKGLDEDLEGLWCGFCRRA